MSDYVPEETEPPERPTPPSKTPSWIMLGFGFGALFMWALPRHEPPAPAAIQLVPPPALAPAGAPIFTLIENVFAEHGGDAIWENDLTEVALWNGEKNSYADCYEVLRVGETHYFRTIAHFTRPVLTHGVKVDSPLQFTEPQARLNAWLRERNEQTFKAFSEAARQNIPAPGAERK